MLAMRAWLCRKGLIPPRCPHGNAEPVQGQVQGVGAQRDGHLALCQGGGVLLQLAVTDEMLAQLAAEDRMDEA